MHRITTLPSTDLNPEHSDTQVTDAGYRGTGSSTGGQASILANANNVVIKGGTFSITTNGDTERKPALGVLYKRVAPNAILNDGGRADDAKCHPGTREEVIGLIEKWMDAAESNRILWLSGPAGGGKTAIMNAIVERSANRGVQTINFFFFRGDSTRNGAQPVVATLLYQIFQLYPHFSDAIANIIATHPRILDMSVTEQFKLISKLSPLLRQSSPKCAQIILLIDGLDECDVDADRSQGDILRALESLVIGADPSFRLLIASRPEARIKLAFNQLSSPTRTIFLDEEYLPERDVRTFVPTAEFDRIKASHPSASSLPDNWPSDLDLESIVLKSSGQFIYAATVMRYISHPSTVPSLGLERVHGIVPVANNSPFTHLDSIYLFILSRVDDPDVMHDMLSMSLLRKNSDIADLSLTKFLYTFDSRYNTARVESCVSELSAIVQLTPEGNLKFYHASLPDMLVDQARSGTYWINVDAFRAKVLLVLWEMPNIKPLGYFSRNLQEVLFVRLKKPTPEITHALRYLPFPDWTREGTYTGGNKPEVHEDFFMKTIETLYYQDDIKVYKHILRRFIHMLVCLDLPPAMDRLTPYAEQYLSFYRRLNWWFKLLNIVRREKSGRRQSNAA